MCLFRPNCRQKGDPKILELAGAFSDGSKYYNESLDLLEKEGEQSDGISIFHWSNISELNNKIDQALEQVFELYEIDSEEAENQKFTLLNKLFGLYDSGYFPGNDTSKLQLNEWQILTPYRPSGFGTLGLNKHIQSNYREDRRYKGSEDALFKNADKVIRLNNWYVGYQESRKLKLSNGSIGLYSVSKKGESWRFPEDKFPLYNVDNTENFDLAYAITIHKSQGSDFENVFLIIPEKKALLSRELLYTALTRSRERIFVFIQKGESDHISYARYRSDTARRNSSLFSLPEQFDKSLVPEGASYSVRSRIEFIIHNALTQYGLKPLYEEKLLFKKRDIYVRPDFTIKLSDGRVIYWEHLGMLDQRKYYHDWQRKRQGFEEEGSSAQLLTTDDLGGIHDDKIKKVIDDILENTINQTPDSLFSHQHYRLY